MPPSGYLCEREAYLHGFERHGNRAVLLPFDQTQFLKARHIGMDIRIIALGGFCQRVNAARAFAAQCVEEVQARRSQFGEQRGAIGQFIHNLLTPFLALMGVYDAFDVLLGFPGQDAETVIAELGALVFDIQTRGNLAGTHWGVALNQPS